MFMATWAGSCVASMGAYLGCSAMSCFSTNVMKQSARVAYCFLFSLAMIAAWLMRDFGKPLLEKIPWIVRHFTGQPSDEFFGIQAVYRISLGNFFHPVQEEYPSKRFVICHALNTYLGTLLSYPIIGLHFSSIVSSQKYFMVIIRHIQLYFALLSAILASVKYRSDKRAKFLMSGSPAIKLGFWVIFTILPFFLPNSWVLAYGYLARAGSLAFLVIQMFILLDFVLAMNDSAVAAGEEDERYYHWLLAATCACYVACLGLVGFLFFWFKPTGAGSCTFNVSIIVSTILLFLAFSLLSVSPLVRTGSLFPSALISLYLMYLAYGALQSEPHEEACNGLGHEIDAASGSTLAVGMAIMLLSVVYSAFKAGSNTETFTLYGDDGDDQEEPLVVASNATSAGLDGELTPGVQVMDKSATAPRAVDEFEPVTYNYGFFHLVFALASMYIAMLLTGWGAGSEERNLLDIGWASVYMKLVTLWGTGLLYMWVLMAPSVCQDRSFE